MKINLNGKETEIPDGSTVSDLLAKYGLDSKPVIAELNGSIIKGEHCRQARLKQGDMLEIVRLVGGG
jgi:sulfur carrier protein